MTPQPSEPAVWGRGKVAGTRAQMELRWKLFCVFSAGIQFETIQKVRAFKIAAEPAVRVWLFARVSDLKIADRGPFDTFFLPSVLVLFKSDRCAPFSLEAVGGSNTWNVAWRFTDRRTDRPVGVVAAPRRLLHSGAAELLKAEVEAEGFTLGTPGASAGLPVEHAAALLTSSPRLVLDRSLAFSVALLHHL